MFTRRLACGAAHKIAMVFQHFALFPHMSVIDNVAYGLKVKGIGATQRRLRAQAPWSSRIGGLCRQRAR